MKFKKVMAIALSAVLTLSLTACGGSSSSGADTGAVSSGAETTDAGSDDAGEGSTTAGSISYKDITLGETGADLNVTLKMLSHRTDMLQDDYNGVTWEAYLEEFNKDYPNITVEIEGITDYAEDSLLRLQGGDWGDIMMIPAVAKPDLPTYFLSFGSVDDVSKEVNFINNWTYGGQVYGIPTTANAQGIVYNKKVFQEAGVTETPKTPEEFNAALKKVKENTNAIPLYTNYAAGWTLGAWDAYLLGSSGNSNWQNEELVHGKDPFADPGDGSHPYNVYKILYDTVADGLIEDDYSTTDWEGCKGMINNGEIATMVLGSWAVPQMQGAGDHAEDIGYMPFPVQVGGKQYASSGPDYNFGISADASADNQLAAMIFVKWMTEKSGFSYNEGGLPIATDDTKVPDLYSEFDAANVIYLSDDPAPEGEEDLKGLLDSDSELNVNNGGNDKVAAIIENASTGAKDFDSIMADWNEKWTEAQEEEGVEVN